MKGMEPKDPRGKPALKRPPATPPRPAPKVPPKHPVRTPTPNRRGR